MSIALAKIRDTSTFAPGGTLDRTSRVITGPRVIVEWVVRSWLTPTGSMFWAPDRGFDLVGLENADLTITDLQRVRSRLIREAEAIEYVQSATVKCTLLAGTLYVEATINLIDGKSYPLAVTIDGAGDALANFFRLAA